SPARRGPAGAPVAFRPGSRAPRRCARSVVAVSLLAPWVSVVVVAEGLPEAGFVLLEQRQSTQPLGALPEVEVRHEQPGGPAVLRRQRLAVVGVDHPGAAVDEVL